MQIKVEGHRVLFIYANYPMAELAMMRLKHLLPRICSHNGHLNAVVVDMEKMPTQGEMQ